MRRALLLPVLMSLLLTAACNEAPETDGWQGAGNSAAPASALEKAAQKAGIVPDEGGISPVGLYRSKHEAGRDSLCLVPRQGTAENNMRFGMEAHFGEGIRCRGQGAARLSGDTIILNFDRSACLIVARYEGDRIALPGVADKDCAQLCTERGSLEGVSFPRVSRDASVAGAAQDDAGDLLCSGA